MATNRQLLRPLYFLQRAIANLVHAPLMSLVATATIALSLFVGAIFALSISGGEALLNAWGGAAHLTLYLSPAAPDEAARILAQRAAFLAGPQATVQTVTHDAALARLKHDLGDLGRALDGLEENPLSPLVEVRLPRSANAAEVRALADQFARIPEVIDVDYGRAWLDRLTSLLLALRWTAILLGVVVLAATIFLVSNTIQLTVFARREEIEIMKLCGGTDWFVRTPFLIEGALQGLAGGLIALGGVALARHLLLPKMADALAFAAGMDLPRLLPSQMLAVAGGGAALGLLGSALAVGRFLRA